MTPTAVRSIRARRLAAIVCVALIESLALPTAALAAGSSVTVDKAVG